MGTDEGNEESSGADKGNGKSSGADKGNGEASRADEEAENHEKQMKETV